MNSPSLEQIAAQLKNPDVKQRVLAMLELQKETMPVQDAYPLIKAALEDEAVQIRGMAAFALGVKQTPENLAVLVQLLATDADYNVRAMAAGALGYLADPRAVDSLRHAFYEDPNWLVQFSAAVALGNLKDEQAKTLLLEALDSSNLLLQEAAIMAFGELGSVEVVDRLLPFHRSPDWMLRKRLAEALGNLPCASSRSTLNALQADDNPQVAEAANLAQARLAELT